MRMLVESQNRELRFGGIVVSGGGLVTCSGGGISGGSNNSNGSGANNRNDSNMDIAKRGRSSNTSPLMLMSSIV